MQQITICGQLIGMANFLDSFVGRKPALCKLKTEKVALMHVGKYSLVSTHNNQRHSFCDVYMTKII